MEKKQLRAIGHQLNPVVMIAGKGLSESVLEEINRALFDHELIKIKLAIDDRIARQEVTQELCTLCGAELVQAIGKVILILRRNPKPNPKTSNLIRYLAL